MGTGAISAQLSHSNWKLFWKVKLLARILTCVWKIMQDSFPMFETLQRRGVMNSANCLMCDSEVESTSHLFLQCNFARVVWHGSALAIRTTELNSFSVKQWIWNYIKTNSITGSMKMELLQAMFTLLWSIWNHRNMVLRKGKVPNPMEVVLMS